MVNLTRGIQAMSIEHYMSNRASIFCSKMVLVFLIIITELGSGNKYYRILF